MCGQVKMDKKNYPEFLLQYMDEELWVHKEAGIYFSLDGVYSRTFDQIGDAVVLVRAGL